MPDFMLCNSKLTFQMTMTPEKTNYLTMGADGQKRLKQGPDLGSYRGLSVIHSRAFSLEKGQHPRDILRRRVRTAEYYRILPHKDNWKREFELYNEGRDTYFTLTFDDLLRFADLHHMPFSHAYASAEARPSFAFMPSVGRYYDGQASSELVQKMDQKISLLNRHPLQLLYRTHDDASCIWTKESFNASGASVYWDVAPFVFDLDSDHHFPESDMFSKIFRALAGFNPVPRGKLLVAGPSRLFHAIARVFVQEITTKATDLNLPFLDPAGNKPISVRSTDQNTSLYWFAVNYYLEVYRRNGVSQTMVRMNDSTANVYRTIAGQAETLENPFAEANVLFELLSTASRISPAPTPNYAAFFLSPSAQGSVNHVLHLVDSDADPENMKRFTNRKRSHFLARTFFITRDLLFYFCLTPDQAKETTPLVKMHTRLSNAQKQTFLGLLDEMEKLCNDESTITEMTLDITAQLCQLLSELMLKDATQGFSDENAFHSAVNGYSTFPMELTSLSHWLHEDNPFIPEALRKDFHREMTDPSNQHFGHAPLSLFEAANEYRKQNSYHNARKVSLFCKLPSMPGGLTDSSIEELWEGFFECLLSRLHTDPMKNADFFHTGPWKNLHANDYPRKTFYLCAHAQHFETVPKLQIPQMCTSLPRTGITIDLQKYASPDDLTPPGGGGRGPSPPRGGGGRGPSPPRGGVPRAGPSWQGGGDSSSGGGAMLNAQEELAAKLEFVIIRPNIEHNMLGVILGQGGSDLGQTLWGQTELSCYDDSMHGIWGMSYKYHERAIVFNEKNLIRLWDVAYDGYNGGKDDTHVDWNRADGRNGYTTFQEHTMNLGESYRGPSMMVMAFDHGVDRRGNAIGFQRNWPSPIVFHDNGGGQEAMPIDIENLHIMDVDEFRVLNTPAYQRRYEAYKERMPPFQDLHKMRKTAGNATAENETQANSLAFQGSMRVKVGGQLLQEIHGSGHHGPDYVGVASVRAGKGIKYTGQAPVLSHAV